LSEPKGYKKKGKTNRTENEKFYMLLSKFTVKKATKNIKNPVVHRGKIRLKKRKTRKTRKEKKHTFG